MMRFASIACLLVLLAAGLFGLWWTARSGAGPARIPAASETSEAPDARPLALAEEEPSATTARRSADLLPDEPSVSPEPGPELPVAPPSRPELVDLNGTALLVDRTGVERAGESGRFRLRWRLGAAFEKREVEVLGGRWSVEVPPDVMLRVDDLVLAEVAVLLEKDDLTVPEDHFLVLRGREREGALLHVLSALDDRELDGVDVWPGPYGFATGIQHPGAEPEGKAIARNATSPVRLPPRTDSGRWASQYLARAPGHAWGSIAIDREGGDRTLVLQPASALEVELIGNAEWLDPEVRLWPPDASRWDAYAYAARKPDGEDRAVFESLAPGTYFASVERGWADRRVSYGGATVTVAAGERTTVPVTVELPERPTAVRVSGTLTLPMAWERKGLKLDFGGEGPTEMWTTDPLEVPLAAMRELAGGPPATERFAWELELPKAGPYRLEVFPLLVRRLIEVPEGGLGGVDVVVPFPANVEARVTDAESGEEIEVEALHWSPPSIEGIVATPLYVAVVDPELGRVTFRAPAGEIRLSPVDMSLMPVERNERFLLEPGHNELELRVNRQFGVRFTFKDGEATIPWDWSWRLSAHKSDGSARDVARSIGILWFREGGRYELRSNGIPGYQSIDGTPIDVVAGQAMSDVEIPLFRE